MIQSDIRREVNVLLQSMGIPQKAITDKASFQKDLGLDSLDFAEMVMEFEMRFQIDIPFNEVEKISTVLDAILYITSAVNQKNTTNIAISTK